jgi:wyosine [tRNA(Phe)-imidazoG37] synthetase (radical SAM superfamily)
MSLHYLFGPVQSRRLGTSLGIDCITPKTCNLDCIYCECGATTHKTMVQKEYFPASAIKDELRTYLASSPKLDYITFGGCGEPTLNSKTGELIRFLKKEFPHYKTALLTNGTLLYLPEVRDAIMPFDCILPSLDAISEPVFNAINRPAPDLDVNKMIEGLVSFSKRYGKMLWIEVFIVPGINDSPDELGRFKEVLSRIIQGRKASTRVQLNSLDRPGTLDDVPIASAERLSEIAKTFFPLPVEIISRAAFSPSLCAIPKEAEETVLAALRRRPMTIEEIGAVGSITINHAFALIEQLSQKGVVTSRFVGDRRFYSVMD